MFHATTFAEIVRDEHARMLREYNDCHTPAGSPAGGQFCSKGAAAAISQTRQALQVASQRGDQFASATLATHLGKLQRTAAATAKPSRIPKAFAAAQAVYAEQQARRPGERGDRTATKPMPATRKEALKAYGEMYRVLRGWYKLSKRELKRRGVPPPETFIRRKPGLYQRTTKALFDWGPAAQDVWW